MSQTGDIIWVLVLLFAPFLISPVVIAVVLVMRRRIQAALMYGMLGYAIPLAAAGASFLVPADIYEPNGLGWLFFAAPLLFSALPPIFAACVLYGTRARTKGKLASLPGVCV